MKKILFKLSLSIYVIFGIFIYAPSVSAVSEYDNAYKTVSTVTLVNQYYECAPVQINSINELQNLWQDPLVWEEHTDYLEGQDFWERNFTEDGFIAGSIITSPPTPESVFQELAVTGINSQASELITSENYQLEWQYYSQYDVSSVGIVKKDIVLNVLQNYHIVVDNVSNCDVQIRKSSNPGNFAILSDSTGQRQNWFIKGLSSDDYNYPVDYEGLPIKTDPLAPEKLTPEYKATVSESGLLKVQYLKNLTPFLTGTTYTNIDQMNTNWNGLDSQVGQWVSQPAGLMQEEIQLSGAGYYMLNISHNQQLDNPPWPENHNYTIEQVWIQFYWDGKSFTEFTNIGCSGQICNDFNDDVDPTYKVFSSLGIPLFGFQQVVLKPLDFLSEISNETQNCTPLNLPLPFIDENITLPCMTPIYQNNFGNILLIYQTILTGLFAYYVGLNTFRGIKDLSNPRDDSIEVGKL